jgi:molybdopterin molybdotransferase
VLGLPGNPASALVCAQLFLQPILRALQGANPAPRLVAVRTAAALEANGPREHWMRARLSHDAEGALWAHPLENQDSSMVTIFAVADALVRRPRGAASAAPGDPVDALILDRLS